MWFGKCLLISTVICSLIELSFGQSCVVTAFEDVDNAVLNCGQIILDNLKVPAGVTLKLNLTQGTEVIFRGNTSFGFEHWIGPLVLINGTNITVRGEEGNYKEISNLINLIKRVKL